MVDAREGFCKLGRPSRQGVRKQEITVAQGGDESIKTVHTIQQLETQITAYWIVRRELLPTNLPTQTVGDLPQGFSQSKGW